MWGRKVNPVVSMGIGMSADKRIVWEGCGQFFVRLFRVTQSGDGKIRCADVGVEKRARPICGEIDMHKMNKPGSYPQIPPLIHRYSAVIHRLEA